jgi:hypothetical protein
MKPVQDMTLDECRDEIAVAIGWVRDRPSVYATGSWRGPDNAWMHGLDHPVPATIDSIAASLPPEYEWRTVARFRLADGAETGWGATVQYGAPDEPWYVNVRGCDTEILARARCCVAAWRKYKENAQ